MQDVNVGINRVALNAPSRIVHWKSFDGVHVYIGQTNRLLKNSISANKKIKRSKTLTTIEMASNKEEKSILLERSYKKNNKQLKDQIRGADSEIEQKKLELVRVIARIDAEKVQNSLFHDELAESMRHKKMFKRELVNTVQREVAQLQRMRKKLASKRETVELLKPTTAEIAATPDSTGPVSNPLFDAGPSKSKSGKSSTATASKRMDKKDANSIVASVSAPTATIGAKQKKRRESTSSANKISKAVTEKSTTEKRTDKDVILNAESVPTPAAAITSALDEAGPASVADPLASIVSGPSKQNSRRNSTASAAGSRRVGIKPDGPSKPKPGTDNGVNLNAESKSAVTPATHSTPGGSSSNPRAAIEFGSSKQTIDKVSRIPRPISATRAESKPVHGANDAVNSIAEPLALLNVGETSPVSSKSTKNLKQANEGKMFGRKAKNSDGNCQNK